MALHITTHDPSTGSAIFSPQITQLPPPLPIPIGTIQILSSTHTLPLDLSTESDITQLSLDRTQAFFSGSRRICPENGTSVCLMSLKPGAGVEDGIMHRTMTFDVVVMVEGRMECHLDSGEMRVLGQGDVLVQRATMHKWVNVTPEDGWARWVVFIQAAGDEIRLGEKTLGPEWVHE